MFVIKTFYVEIRSIQYDGNEFIVTTAMYGHSSLREVGVFLKNKFLVMLYEIEVNEFEQHCSVHGSFS
jgi:hypothetical protein